MKGIIDIYQENKNTGALIFGDDFGIPVRIVEVSRQIAAVLSLLSPQSPFQETLGEINEEIKGIIRILKEFEDAGIEQLLVDDISKKAGSKAILINNMLIFQSPKHESIGAAYGFTDLPAFHRALSRLISWLNC